MRANPNQGDETMGMYSPDELMNLAQEQYEDSVLDGELTEEEWDYIDYCEALGEGEEQLSFEAWQQRDQNRDAAGNWIGPVAYENGWTA